MFRVSNQDEELRILVFHFLIKMLGLIQFFVELLTSLIDDNL